VMTGMSCFGFWDSIHLAKSRKDICSTLHVLTKSLSGHYLSMVCSFTVIRYPWNDSFYVFNSRKVGELRCHAFSPEDGEIGVDVIPVEEQLSTSLLFFLNTTRPECSLQKWITTDWYLRSLCLLSRFVYEWNSGKIASQCVCFGSSMPSLALPFGPASSVDIDGVGQTGVSVYLSIERGEMRLFLRYCVDLGTFQTTRSPCSREPLHASVVCE
jgi:hypothetical protein